MLIIGCEKGIEKGIEKEGKAVFKIFGKEHTLSIDRPTAKPSTIGERPPTSSHDPSKTSTKVCTGDGEGETAKIPRSRPLRRYDSQHQKYRPEPETFWAQIKVDGQVATSSRTTNRYDT